MIVLEFEKNSEDWMSFKQGKSGGSILHDLYPARDITREVAKDYLEAKGVEVPKSLKAAEVVEMLTAEDIGYIKAQGDKKDAYYKLAAQRIARPFTPNDYVDAFEAMFGYRKDSKITFMDRGHILEPEAIKEFEKRNKKKVDTNSVVWQRDDNPSSIFSPDGPITEKGIVKESVEIKCFDSHRMIRAYDENKYPAECHEQIIKAFIVNENLEVKHFVMYTDLMPSLPYLQFDVKREDVERDIRELRAFEDSILEQVDALTERLAF